MFKKIGIIALILLLTASLAAAASEDKTNTAKSGGYTVTPAWIEQKTIISKTP